MSQTENPLPGSVPGALSKNLPAHVQCEKLVQRTLAYWLVIFSIGLPAMIIFYPKSFGAGTAVGVIALYIALAAITLVRAIPYHIRAGAAILALLVSGAVAMANNGLDPSAVLFLTGSVIVASTLYDARAGYLTTAAAFTVIAIFGLLVTTGILVPFKASELASFTNTGSWVMASVVFFFLVFVITSPKSSPRPGEPESETVQEQEAWQERERLSEERIAVLQKRARLYETTGQVARSLAEVTGSESILTTAADRICAAFGFYHVGIYINDRKKEYSVLRAAAGEAGLQMLELGYHVRVGEVSLLGDAVNRGEANSTRSVDSQLAQARNPLLPQTRSVAALPLRTPSQIIGAIEIHSEQENTFQEGEMLVLQILAGQIANAYAKARQFEELQQNFDELEASHSAATQKAWASHLRNTRQKLAYRYRNAKLEPIPTPVESWSELPESDSSRVRVIKQPSADGSAPAILAVPIKMRNQVLGVVELQFESTTISPGMVELIQGSVDRLAVSLENARLMEEIQIRAERERMVGDISAKVRAASDVDSVLRIAVQEIGKTLGVSDVMLQLRKDA